MFGRHRNAPFEYLVAGLVLFGLAGCKRGVEADLLRGRAPSSVTHVKHAERLTDGVRSVPGDAWDSNLTSVMDRGASVEWDLGASEPIAAAYLQGDHNDEYAVLTSEDRRAWQTLWEAASMGGEGQQARMTRELHGRGRFVRLEPRGGDGMYSATEFALFRSSEVPLPPTLREQHGEREANARRELAIPLAIAALFALSTLAMGLGRGRGNRDPSRLTRQTKLALLAGAALLVCVTAILYRGLYRNNTIDDAYISFQYAKNWASGHGLVFNLGERVEGYTNFLWVALLVPLWPLCGGSPDAFASAAFVLTLGLAVLGLVLLARIAAREFQSRAPFVLALLLLAFDDAFIAYAVFALENHLLIVCALLAIYATVFRFRDWQLVAGGGFALVAMTRLDGGLLALAFFAVEAAQLLRADAVKRRSDLGSLGTIAFAFLVPFGVYFALRFQYYGYLFPNTFYLKVGDTFGAVPRGLAYAQSFLSDRRGVPLLALLGVAAWNKRPWVRWLLLYALLHFAYVIYVGGDFYSGQRFLLVLTPVLALLAGAGADALIARWPRQMVEWAVLLAGIAACILLRWGTLSDGPGAAEIKVWADVVDNDIRTMRWMKQVARPSASIMLGDIGCAGFFADLRVIDVYGVIDHGLAHRKIKNFGAGKPGHEKVATWDDLRSRQSTYIKPGYIDVPYPLPGYYVFNDFPPGIDIGELLVRDDLALGQTLLGFGFHMDREELETWTREGDAFANAPSAGSVGGQANVAFADGSLINSFTAQEGNRATGRLLSPSFALEGDRMRLLVGGGRDPLRLRVSLWVDERAVFSETGTNHESLGRREWDITPYRGKQARIEIVDQATGNWGHILVDEITQWSGRPNQTGKL